MGGGGSQPNHPKVPHKIMVPNIYVLRGYAVTPLRICYCINKCTQIMSVNKDYHLSVTKFIDSLPNF